MKWEGANPTGSMKDRMALSMIEGAEGRGVLRPGGRVVDYTGGSTGSSLAMVCAAKGYRAHFVSSDAFAEEKLQTMRAFGAELEVIPSVDRKVTPALQRAKRLGPGHRVVTVICDSGLKYLQGALFRQGQVPQAQTPMVGLFLERS